MRYVSFALTVLYFGLFTLQAQHTKGDVAVSLQAAPFITTEGPNNLGAIGLISSEFFIANKVSAEISFFYSNNTLFNNENDLTVHGYGIIPSVQYYVLNKKSFDVFAKLGFGFGFEDLTRNQIQNSALTVFTVGAGGHYHFNEHWSLRLLVPYFHAKNITLNGTAARGPTAFVGIVYRL